MPRKSWPQGLPSEGRHFAFLLVRTVAGDPGRQGISTGDDHVLLAWLVPHRGGKTFLDNGKNLYSAGVESAVNHLHSD